MKLHVFSVKVSLGLVKFSLVPNVLLLLFRISCSVCTLCQVLYLYAVVVEEEAPLLPDFFLLSNSRHFLSSFGSEFGDLFSDCLCARL